LAHSFIIPHSSFRIYVSFLFCYYPKSKPHRDQIPEREGFAMILYLLIAVGIIALIVLHKLYLSD
jgi:hypothetical protein